MDQLEPSRSPGLNPLSCKLSSWWSVPFGALVATGTLRRKLGFDLIPNTAFWHILSHCLLELDPLLLRSRGGPVLPAATGRRGSTRCQPPVRVQPQLAPARVQPQLARSSGRNQVAPLPCNNTSALPSLFWHSTQKGATQSCSMSRSCIYVHGDGMYKLYIPTVCHFMLYQIMLYHIISHDIILHYISLHYITLHCTVLYHFIVWHTMLCCVIL